MKHTLSKDCACKPVVEDYREKAEEPKGRDWLHKLFDKPSNKRNGPDVVSGHKAIDWLFDEREELLAQVISLSKEVDDYKSLIAVFQSGGTEVKK